MAFNVYYYLEKNNLRTFSLHYLVILSSVSIYLSALKSTDGDKNPYKESSQIKLSFNNFNII